MYINTFKYTPKDVSCQLCTEYVKKLGCTALRCPWLAERIEAGVVGYRKAVLETFPHERRLFQRLNLLIKHYPGSLWSNEQHERRMQYQCAVQGYRRRRDTNAYYAAMYLLTSNDDIYRRTANCFCKDGIEFGYAKKGYADKADCKWSATTIIRILQDETYTGTLVQGKQGTPHYKIKQMEQRPASEWVRVPDAHEALIARQDFELVQRIKGLDTRTSPNEDTVYLFSGILICGCCGSRMTRKTNRANGKEYNYYYCPTGKKKGCTHPVMLKESSLIDCVRDSLKAYIGNIASLEALLTGIDQTSINQALAKEYSDHITDNERRLEQVLEFKARLYESLVGGMLTKEEYASYKAKYTKQASDIRESVRILKEKLTAVLENRSERNRWISQFTQFSTLETLDRRALIHMVQSIRVRGKKELDITFTHEDEYQKALQLLTLAAQQKDYEQRKVG